MCGRFDLSTDPEALTDWFGVQWRDLPYKERYNVAPTDPILVLGSDGDVTHADYMRWGLIPYWKKPDQKLPLNINARAETVATTGSFKWPFRYRRCLIPATGFYEWETRERPFRIGTKDWSPFAFAGIWDRWRGPEGEVRSCAIITTAPNGLVEPIHDRMPVILDWPAWTAWLDRSMEDDESLHDLLIPFPEAEVAMYGVSTLVNKVQNDVPSVIQPAA